MPTAVEYAAYAIMADDENREVFLEAFKIAHDTYQDVLQQTGSEEAALGAARDSMRESAVANDVDLTEAENLINSDQFAEAIANQNPQNVIMDEEQALQYQHDEHEPDPVSAEPEMGFADPVSAEPEMGLADHVAAEPEMGIIDVGDLPGGIQVEQEPEINAGKDDPAGLVSGERVSAEPEMGFEAKLPEGEDIIIRDGAPILTADDHNQGQREEISDPIESLDKASPKLDDTHTDDIFGKGSTWPVDSPQAEGWSTSGSTPSGLADNLDDEGGHPDPVASPETEGWSTRGSTPSGLADNLDDKASEWANSDETPILTADDPLQPYMAEDLQGHDMLAEADKALEQHEEYLADQANETADHPDMPAPDAQADMTDHEGPDVSDHPDTGDVA